MFNPASSTSGGSSGGGSGGSSGGGSGGFNWNSNAGYGAGILGGIGSFFTQNPSNAANQYYNQIPGFLQGNYAPWIQGGQWAQGQLQGQIGNMLQNPGGFINQIGAGYQASPGFNWQVGQSTMAANNAAAAGGMAGSPAEQQSLASTVTGLANQNYQNYIQNAMGAYGLGFGGAENMYNTGANMANAYGENYSNALMNQGNLAYSGAINQNQSMLGGLGGIGMGIGGLLSKL